MAFKTLMNKIMMLFALFLPVMFLPPAIAVEVDASDPQAIVKDASDRMLQALKDNETALEEDPTEIYALVQEILMPNFDFEKMSMLALGKNWRRANTEQKAQFVEEFRLLLVRTYSTAMLEYTDEEIRFLPSDNDLSTRRAKVAMEVLQAAGPSIPMALSMYQNKGGEWKVYDVVIDGVSVVKTYRTQYGDFLEQKSFADLIDTMKTKLGTGK